MIAEDLVGRIFHEYKIERKIGSGGFGDIYIGSHIKTKKEYALKFESRYGPNAKGEHEATVYKELAKRVFGIPQVHWHGVDGIYYIVVIQLLGPSLSSLLTYCGGKFSLKTVVMVAHQLLERIESIHHNSYIHRDLKPENIVMGTGLSKRWLYLIDFGMAKRVKNDNYHIPFRDDKLLTGTARYASLNSHRGEELSRRDDLEAMTYTLIYLLKGKLPWQGLLHEDTSDRDTTIYYCKKSTPIDTLCEGLEPEFASLLKYARNLSFTQKPDYSYVRGLFNSIVKRKNIKMDYMFDWTLKKMEQEAELKARLKKLKKQRLAKPTRPPPAKKPKTHEQNKHVSTNKQVKDKKALLDIVCRHNQIIKSNRSSYYKNRTEMKQDLNKYLLQYYKQRPKQQCNPHDNGTPVGQIVAPQ